MIGASQVAISFRCSFSVGTTLAKDTTSAWKHLLTVARMGRINFRMPETVKERVDKYPAPENGKFLCTTTISEEVWDLLPRRSRTVYLAFQKIQE